MPIDRFYLDSPLEQQARVTLSSQEHHHLARVTRSQVGDEVELINGNGTLALAKVLDIQKSKATLLVTSALNETPTKFPIIIAQAIPRLNRLETIVEKSTELGMDELHLFPGKLSEKKDLKENQLERLSKIAVSAAKQSGRLFVPSITIHPPIKNWKPKDLPLYFGDLSDQAPPMLKQWDKSPPEKGLIFVIGPESGLHDEEILRLKELNGIGVKLHQNILRTDTAPLAVLSIISQMQL